MLVLGSTGDIELATPGTDEVLDLLRYSDPVAPLDSVGHFENAGGN